MNLFDINNLKKKLQELENKTSKPDFWNDTENSGKVLSDMKKIKNKCETYEKIQSELNNLLEMNELLKLEYEEEMAKEVIKGTRQIEKEIEKTGVVVYEK